MPAYLTPEWVQAFNAALAGIDLTDAIAVACAGSVTASLGSFSMAQVVTDAPPEVNASGGSVRTVLTVDEGRVTLVSDPAENLRSNVTIVLTYRDAVAIARTLQPADALTAGRVRVRGELAVLVAGQAVLNAAAAALGQTLTDLTDLGDAANPDATNPDAADPKG